MQNPEAQWFSCASRGNISLLKESLAEFAGAQDAQGNTALIYAAAHGHLSIIELLAPHELHLVNLHGESAEDVAVAHRQAQAAQLLRDARTPGTRLWTLTNSSRWFDAARSGDVGFIKSNYQFFVKQRDNRQQFRGMTALMHAAACDQAQVVRVLGEEKGLKTPKGRTALSIAAECGAVNALRLLTDELGGQDEYGWCALMYAVDAQFAEGVEILSGERGLKNAFGLRAADIARQRGFTVGAE